MSGEAFELPPQFEGSAWDELLVLCPYDAPPHSVHVALADAASRIDTSSTDASQWLLFRTGDEASVLTLERSSVDFCAVERDPGVTYVPETSWVSDDSGQIAVLTPEGL